jgi:hypothetical protein
MKVAGLLLPLLLLFGACAAPPQPNAPDFARIPYEPLSREAVVAIALREWRAFGSKVNDTGTDLDLTGDAKPERQPGLWQRVGEYWWEGLAPGRQEAAWTGKHDEHGIAFPPEVDGNYAWSAVFVSYVMRIAGAGPGFPYAADHADYINIAKRMATRQASGWAVVAERPESYTPQPGDLICNGRGSAARLRYDDLPTGRFPAHCDIVVEVAADQLTAIGGNVDDAVTMRHLPLIDDQRLAVLRVLYSGPGV